MEIIKLIKINYKDINVYLSNDSVIKVNINAIAKFNLYKGKILSEENINEINQYINQSSLTNKCIKLINNRPRSEREIREYLNKINKDENLINSIINKLIEDKYINDIEFSKWWIDNRNLFKLKSKKEIKYELMKKGIKEDILNTILNTNDEIDDINKIKQICIKKYDLEDISGLNIKEKNKIVKYLLNKGFNYDDIKKAVISHL